MVINKRYRGNRYPQGCRNDPREAVKGLLWGDVENVVSAENLQTQILLCIARQQHLLFI